MSFVKIELVEMDVFQELSTHVCKNHVQNDIYRVNNAWFHSVGMDVSLAASWIWKGTTYMIAIIVLYLEDSRGPKMERAFRAIHQMRPARNSFMSVEKKYQCERTSGKKRTHENSNE